MATRIYCDLCGKFIVEFGKHKEANGKLNKPFVISRYYEGKSLLDEDCGWSGPEDEIEFWACDECNKKFMDETKEIAIKLGLKI